MAVEWLQLLAMLRGQSCPQRASVSGCGKWRPRRLGLSWGTLSTVVQTTIQESVAVSRKRKILIATLVASQALDQSTRVGLPNVGDGTESASVDESAVRRDCNACHTSLHRRCGR